MRMIIMGLSLSKTSMIKCFSILLLRLRTYKVIRIEINKIALDFQKHLSKEAEDGSM